MRTILGLRDTDPVSREIASRTFTLMIEPSRKADSMPRSRAKAKAASKPSFGLIAATVAQSNGPSSMGRCTSGIHSLAFKKQVVQEYAGGATLNALAREHDLPRTLIRISIAKCENGEPDVEAATLLGDYEVKIADGQ
jgi:hypothetical protein